jgi:hypothetical protein
MFFQYHILLIGGWGLYLQECVVQRSVRTDRRWDVGVGVGCGKPGSIVRVWRSLDIDHHVDFEPAKRGHHGTNNEQDCRDGRSG